MRSATTTTTVLLLLLLLPGQFLLSAAAFSEESLKDLSRLPHFQRIWLQRLDQSNRRNSNNFSSSSSSSAKVTTSSARPSSSTATSTWTDPSTTDESLEEVVDGDERVTTVGPSAVGRNADAGMESTGGKVTLTISEAKERLKARKIKSRKVKTVMQQQKEEEEEQQLNNQGHYQYNKKTDNIFRDETEEEAVEVKKHIQRMASAGCSTPALRLIYVRQQHEAAPNVRYLPACTWLHRCSDETGCCTDDSKICSASHIESVSLPFFVLTMTGSETKRTVTRLSFENHTACECVGRNSDLMPRTEPYISDPVIRKSRLSSPTTLLYNHDESNNSDEGKSSRHHENVGKSSKTKKGRRHDDPPPPPSSLQLGRVATAYSPDPALLFHARNEEDEEEDSAGAKRRFGGPLPGSNSSNSSSSNLSKCRCPSGFTPVASSRKRSACGLCQCHDYDFGRSRHHHGGIRAANPATARHHHHQNLCGRLKRGLETFSPRDRGCIVEKKCGTPECSYGRYVTLTGRCPRRHELRPRS
ncbi:uncharacterized protein LOC124334507 isoform X1 [Daphnia pulicaria]|uniref:uncharacterized protein LOC124334507 isoform X1 n=1 Tax=Daphnia pulicaria TaxID=35523 RepID=UPI001EEB66DD|nr:uncharacterized protein LOC124334507 isoform X1 [Daphnia pulicaria]XP_046645014.1 uncharacterized protein LOC124334507 isoform X1 [Daphnia pulicaria]XP_046645015.1 uncharacterized protein LOC124334507 isoform X1 [Daphnia pulicaria]